MNLLPEAYIAQMKRLLGEAGFFAYERALARPAERALRLLLRKPEQARSLGCSGDSSEKAGRMPAALAHLPRLRGRGVQALKHLIAQHLRSKNLFSRKMIPLCQRKKPRDDGHGRMGGSGIVKAVSMLPYQISREL